MSTAEMLQTGLEGMAATDRDAYLNRAFNAASDAYSDATAAALAHKIAAKEQATRDWEAACAAIDLAFDRATEDAMRIYQDAMAAIARWSEP